MLSAIRNSILHTGKDDQALTFRHGWKVPRHVLWTLQDRRPLGCVRVEGDRRLDLRIVRLLEVVVLWVLFELARHLVVVAVVRTEVADAVPPSVGSLRHLCIKISKILLDQASELS
jgi:hypothetical protein